MTFDEAFEKLIGHEGGYINHQRDPGGETKFGISKRSYPKENIKGLTLERAKMIYRRDFWDRCHIDELPESVWFDMFDTAVNSGVSTAMKLLQRAAGMDTGEIDGLFGPKTLRAVTNTDPIYLSRAYNGHRLNYYTNLGDFKTFGKGWVRRVASNLIEG
jgi:lysozyme family protein